MIKTWQKGLYFSHVVTASEETATEVNLLITKSEKDDPAMYIVQIYRAGAMVLADAVVSYTPSTGILKIDNGSTYVVTEDDVIMGSISWGEKLLPLV